MKYVLYYQNFLLLEFMIEACIPKKRRFYGTNYKDGGYQ